MTYIGARYTIMETMLPAIYCYKERKISKVLHVNESLNNN